MVSVTGAKRLLTNDTQEMESVRNLDKWHHNYLCVLIYSKTIIDFRHEETKLIFPIAK